VEPGNRSRVNESPHLARLSRGLHHETHQHTVEQIIRKIKSGEQLIAQRNRRRGLPRDRGNAADISPLAAALRRDAGRGCQAPDPT